MTILPQDQQIASAFFVTYGQYGDVTRYAHERGVCPQWIYKEADALRQEQEQARLECDYLRHQLEQSQLEIQQLQDRLAQAVVLDADKQTEVACVAQARGVTLRACAELLEVLRPGQTLSVAELGRRTQAAGVKAGAWLTVLDELTRQKVQEAAVDEISVKDPVLRVVEPESLCWLGGQLAGEVSGQAWAEQLQKLPPLEQVMREGGSGLQKGVALVNQERPQANQPLLVDQGDHYHALRHGGVGLNKAKRHASQALAQAEAAQKALDACARQGKSRSGIATRVRWAWQKAEPAMDPWQEQERLWEQAKGALQVFTPEGELNTRARAEAVLAETLSQLPEADFGKAKRQLQQPEMRNYLDRVEAKLEALPFPAEVKEAALRQEGLRRRPEALQGEGTPAAALRGMLLVCAVVLSKAEPGAAAGAAVREVLGRAYRASSLVECRNSVLRRQQAGHRRMTQGLLDRKRLYGNSHPFRSGKRRKTSPYERLGVGWPTGLRWWETLQLTPEELRARLSTTQIAA